MALSLFAGFSWRRRLGYAALLLLTSLAVVPLANGEVRFVLRSACEEARILLLRRPIAEVIADPATSAERRAQLQLVLEARKFASERLGLEPGETYTTFADIGSGTLVHVISASPRDRLRPHQWSYPVVGSVPYKGFFTKADALAEERRLKRLGYDTYVRPAAAFSTLGWFNDPLLSTALDDDPVELVATVLHEIAHNTLWVSGNVGFNESYANFVGYRGAEAFFKSRGDFKSAWRSAAMWRDEKRLGAFYAGLEGELQRLYSSGAPRRVLEARRREVFARAHSTLAGPLDPQLEVYSGRRLSRRAFNNAWLLANRIYQTGLDELDRTLAAQRGDLRADIQEIVSSFRRHPTQPPMQVLAMLSRPGRQTG